MSERRERYAAALHEVESRCRHDASSFAYHELADAAMAVADAVRIALDGIALWGEVNGYPNTADVLEDIRTALEGETDD